MTTRRQQRIRRLAAGLTLVVAGALAACAPSAPELTRDPYRLEGPLPTAEHDGLWLPRTYEEATLVAPGWQIEPQYGDGIYLAAAERDDALEFTAVDVHGNPRWGVQRPLTCTGFALSTAADGSVVAALTDTESTPEAIAATTVTGYELATGQPAWGPVVVPGPQFGPGLVFAAPPGDAMGPSGPRVALDATTGAVLADERSGERILGEYHGTVLLVREEQVVAVAGAEGSELWSLPLAEYGWTTAQLAPAVDADVPAGLALVQTAPSSAVLLDLATGEVLAQDVAAAAVDATSGALVVQEASSIRALDRERQPLWSISVAPDTTIEAVGGVLLYLREGGAIRVHNVVTGAVAQGYRPDGGGDIAVPVHLSELGAGVLLTDEGYLVATLGEGVFDVSASGRLWASRALGAGGVGRRRVCPALGLGMHGTSRVCPALGVGGI